MMRVVRLDRCYQEALSHLTASYITNEVINV